jgi:Tfp pilus assembly protein PilF
VALAAGLKKLALKDTATALGQLREAVRLDPENARAHYELARVLKTQGQPAEAGRHFAEARRLAPYLDPPPAAAPAVPK